MMAATWPVAIIHILWSRSPEHRSVMLAQTQLWAEKHLPGWVCNWEASSSPCKNSLTAVKLAVTAVWKSFVTVLLYLAARPGAPLGRFATMAVASLLSETHLLRPALCSTQLLVVNTAVNIHCRALVHLRVCRLQVYHLPCTSCLNTLIAICHQLSCPV